MGIFKSFFIFIGLAFFGYVIAAILVIFILGSRSNHLFNGVVICIVSLYYVVVNFLKILELKYFYDANNKDFAEAERNEPRGNKVKAFMHMVLLAVFLSLILSLILTLIIEHQRHIMI